MWRRTAGSLQADRLSIDESALTGESMPVYKKARPLRLENMPIADRTNMVFRGTLVTGGEGLGHCGGHRGLY